MISNLTSNLEKNVRRTRLLLVALGIAILVGETIAMYFVSLPSIISLATAHWIADHVEGGSSLVYEFQANEPQLLTGKWPVAKTFHWQLTPAVDSASLGTWYTRGSHYVVIDERTFPGISFDERLQSLTAQNATLAYKSENPFNLGPRQAVLWTFKPDVLLNVTFGKSLRLIGYSIVHDQQSNQKATDKNQAPTALLLHWYVVAPTTTAFHVFIHVVDPKDGSLLAQSDTLLGDYGHSTDGWHQNEIVFTPIALPPLTSITGPYHIQLGLYDFNTGTRAGIDEATNSPTNGTANNGTTQTQIELELQ